MKPPPPEEVPLPPPAEVKLPPPEEVKPPWHRVALQPAALRAPALSAEEAPWSAKLFHKAFMKLRKVAVHLGVQLPSHPLQTTMKDYTLKVNV
jgi:hypothetical protein